MRFINTNKAISGQRSALSSQLSALSSQLSALSSQRESYSPQTRSRMERKGSAVSGQRESDSSAQTRSRMERKRSAPKRSAPKRFSCSDAIANGEKAIGSEAILLLRRDREWRESDRLRSDSSAQTRFSCSTFS
ncbi:MAG: hypothetical protein F6J93_32480 [Oscillatoria sp. SIO1A7]|nr:hypothetical protein [Oscillatoria sp. SIO1A7]